MKLITKTTLVTILMQKVRPEVTPCRDQEVFTPGNVNRVTNTNKWIAPITLSVAGPTILNATVGRETAVGYPAGQGVAPSVKNTSRYCNCCQKEERNVNFKRCSACKLVYYCSTECQKRHWNDHQSLCKAIQGLPKPQGEHVKGLGDGCDSSVFVSHITPKQQAAVARLVG